MHHEIIKNQEATKIYRIHIKEEEEEEEEEED